MNKLDEKSWDALEGYLCSLTLNQERHELARIELNRRVDVGGYVFTPGIYVKSNKSEMISKIQSHGSRRS